MIDKNQWKALVKEGINKWINTSDTKESGAIEAVIVSVFVLLSFYILHLNKIEQWTDLKIYFLISLSMP